MSGGEHTFHRKRLRERYLREGIDSLEEHVVLEMLLFYSIPRCDTNPIAHRLLNKFGSLAAVFDAPIDALAAVDGMGEASAILIKSIPDFYRRYAQSKSVNITTVNSLEDIGNYLMPYFIGVNVEMVYLLMLDGQRRIIACEKVSDGSLNMAAINVRDVVTLSLKYNASAVVLAHNHPNAMLIPSESDIVTTKRIQTVLRTIDVTLLDHMVMSDTDYVSFHQSGILERL